MPGPRCLYCLRIVQHANDHPASHYLPSWFFAHFQAERWSGQFVVHIRNHIFKVLLDIQRNLERQPSLRHCERSEAIQW